MKQEKVNKAYSELRKIANKRAMRMERAGVISVFSGVYFPKISELDDEGVRSALAAVSRFLRDPRASLSGIKTYRQKMLKTFHEHGYDFVNEFNLTQFTNFMEWARARSGANDRVFKSDRYAEIFEEAEEKGIPAAELQRNFEKYVNDQMQFKKDARWTQRRKNRMDDEQLSNKMGRRGAARERKDIGSRQRRKGR